MVAEKAKEAAPKNVEEQPEAFTTKKKWVLPFVDQYFEVVGGPSNSTGQEPPPLEIKSISSKQFAAYDVKRQKVVEEVSSQGQVGFHAFTLEGCGDSKLNGKWRTGPAHNGRPSHAPFADVDLVIEWSKKGGMSRITTQSTKWVSRRTTFYESRVDMDTMPDYGWQAGYGEGGAPTVKLAMAFTIKNCGNEKLNGPWAYAGEHNSRPEYKLVNGDEDDEFVLQYSRKRGYWRITTVSGWRRTTLYKSKGTVSPIVPAKGWMVASGKRLLNSKAKTSDIAFTTSGSIRYRTMVSDYVTLQLWR